MVNRYGYSWEFGTLTGGGTDGDGNPIAPGITWTAFDCDVQTAAGRFIVADNGDNIPVHYSIFTKENTGVQRGDMVRDPDGVEFKVLQVHPYSLNYEIWV